MKQLNASLPNLDSCFESWLNSQSDGDLRDAVEADIGEMIRDRVLKEIERRAGINRTL